MSVLTVFLAPSGVSDSALAALGDLSAAGLIDEFAWLSDPVAPVESLYLVSGGSGRDVSLGELVTARRTTVLRVCVLVPVFGGHRRLSPAAEQSTVAQLQSTTGAATTVRVRALFALGSEIDEGDSVAVDGWHNILVSPEDARGPGYGAVPWPEHDGASGLGRFLGPAVASLAGLWRGVEHTPLDTQAPLPGHVVRLARSFYRKLDSAELEQRLRAAVLAQGRTLPLPSDQGSQIVPVSDVPAATSAMAGALWHKYAAVLRGERMQYQSSGTERIGAWQLITMFFGFLWASVRNAPAAWARGVVDSVSARLAAGVQNLAFDGAPNVAYEVVVNGRTASGGVAGWSDMGAATAQLNSLVGVGAHQLGGGDDLSQVWQDYAGGAFTLADAAQHVEGVPPIMVGPNRAVVTDVADLVPGPSRRFTAIPGPVAAAVRTDGVDATDPLGIVDLANRLAALQSDPDLALAARGTLDELHAWQRVLGRSYGVAVGERLKDAFLAALTDVRQLMQRVRNRPHLPDDSTESVPAYVKWIQFALLLLAGVGLGVAVFIGAVTHKDAADFPLWAMIVGGLTVLLALVAAVGIAVSKSPAGPNGPNGPRVGDDPFTAFGRWIQVWLVFYLIFVAVAAFLVYRDVHVWWTTALVCLGVGLVLLVSGALAFIKLHQRLFALLHQRRSVLGSYEIDVQNLRTALRDLGRLDQAYRQYLCWSRALGAFLEAPLGPNRQRRTDALPLAWGLPMSTGVGEVRPEPAVIDEVAFHLRHRLFRVGWISRYWKDLLLEALPPVPGGGLERGIDAVPFWRDQGMGTGTGLDGWSSALFRGELTSSGADAVWRSALAELGGPLNQVMPRLVAQVVPMGAPPSADGVSATDFLVGLDRPGAEPGSVNAALVTDSALTTGKTRIVPQTQAAAVVHVGLGRVCALTQFTDALSVDDLRVRGAVSGTGRSTGAPDAPGSSFTIPEFRGGGAF